LSALIGSDIPNLWIPKKEAFFMVEQIPMLASGKLDLQAVKLEAIRCARGQ
jgi:acyl-[acyl-carrier-protein]-phospholipid O-acyltransferase/long-chain-fatty-acid--[acyl-carrier-protein] ligase